MVGSYPTDPSAPNGGVEAATVNLVEALAVREDIEVAVLDLRVGYPRPKEEQFGNVLVVRRPTGGPLGRIRRTRGEISQVLKELDPSIVHVQGAARLLPTGRPSVLTIHGFIERDIQFQKSGIGLYARQATVVRTEVRERESAPNVIAISNHVVERLGPLRGRRVWAIPNAVSAAVFPELGVPKVPSILYVGHVSELKNVALLITAFSRVRKQVPALRLRIAGTGSPQYQKRCTELAFSLGSSNWIDWLGSLPRDAIIAELHRATVLALPSQVESAPMVIAEALTAGLPVVASDVGGVAEMIGSGGGFAVPPGHLRALERALLAVIGARDPRELRRHAAAISARYQPASVAEQTIACYREILGDNFER